MRDVLGETHGVMVYQEQVMRILNQLGGIALPSAYTCIKAISKKKLPMIAKFRDEFVEESVVKGLSHKDAIEMFEMIEKFAGYGFNKSHSTAYALIAYMTAYLKAHHSVEFMAALLSGDIPGRNFKRKDSLVEHLDDCRRMEVEVVPPNVNQSDGDFAVVDGKICFGMAAIKGVGMAAGVCIAKARRADGPYTSLFDFCERVDPAVVNRTAIESLVKAGAFDAFGAARAALAASVDRAIQAGAAVHADRRSGQKGLFDDVDDDSSAATHNLAVVPEWNERTMLAGEREVLGFYLSSHPLSEHENVLRTHCTHTTTQAAALPAGTEVIVGGMISALKLTNTKNPKPGATHTKYAMFDLEDTSGMIRSIIWPRDFAENESLITPDAVVAVRGSVDKRPGSEEANLICNEVMTLEMLEKRFTRGVWIRIDEQSHDADMLSQLKEILRGYPGNCDLQLAIHLKSGARVHCVCEGMKVSLTAEMRERVDGLLGPGHLRSISSAASRPAPRGGRRRGGRTERSGQPA
jgi:DNA polymerase-3 subunit alpha